MKKRFEYLNQPQCKTFPTDKMIFISEKSEKEWEQLDPIVKKNVEHLLKETCNEMSTKVSIEMLCNIINDMNERIKKLEKLNGLSNS